MQMLLNAAKVAAGAVLGTQTPLETAVKLAEKVNQIKVSSLSEYTATTRLSPTVLIDKRVLALNQNMITSLLQSMLSIYSGYYLSAVNVAMSVDSVKVMEVLDRFSTNRSVLQAIKKNQGLEGFEEVIDDTIECLPVYSMESAPQYSVKTTAQTGAEGPKNWDNAKTIEDIRQDSDLVVGKILDIKLASGSNLITIPVIITLVPRIVDPSETLAISSANSKDKSMTGRYHAWRSGEIRFFKDFLFCMDLIEADKKALLADSTRTILASRSRRSNNLLSTALSSSGSPNSISTMIIISKQTATDLEIILKGSLKNSHIRDGYFRDNIAMMLVVVDIRNERFTLYQRGIDAYGEYTFDDIKRNSKSTGGTDIESILKAYQLGSPGQL